MLRTRNFQTVCRVAVISLLTGMASAVAQPAASQPAAPEFRAIACSRFEWPNKDLNACKAFIDTLMKKLQEHNFNAVILQMRGQCDTLYPSPYEPWSPLLSDDGNAPPGWGDFDPFAYAINKAHEHGLEFHAYLNAHVVWNNANPPKAKNHIFYQHANVDDPAHRDWLNCDSNGKPVGFTRGNEYIWVAPGVPSFQAYWRKQIMYVVEHYDGSDPVKRPRVDGVHFDRIRTNSPDWSHDPISEARRQGEANPAGLSFQDWTRDQITRTLCDLYAQIHERHPYIKVSSAPLGMHSSSHYPGAGYPEGDCGFGGYGYSCKLQDAQAWLVAGAQDFICPQIYWADPPWRQPKPHFSVILPDWLKNNAGRHIYPFCNVTATGPGLVAENKSMRKLVAEIGQGNAPGSVIWYYNGFMRENIAPIFKRGCYASPAPLPEMPWKTNPTDGIILGTITDAAGEPVLDAHVSRSDSSYVALSSADGIYSFLKVSPGEYTITVRKTGNPETTARVKVAGGQVVRSDLQVGVPPTVVAATPEPAEAVTAEPAQPATPEPAAVAQAETSEPAAVETPAEPVEEPAAFAAMPAPPAAQAETASRWWLWIVVPLIVAGVSAVIIVLLLKAFKEPTRV